MTSVNLALIPGHREPHRAEPLREMVGVGEGPVALSFFGWVPHDES